MKLKSSKSTKGLASYDLLGYHDHLGGHLGLQLDFIFNVALI